MTGTGRQAPQAILLAAGVAIVLATRLPYLPESFGDVDSLNFERGVHEFYPFGHQPHPPGYAVFIAIARLLHPLLDSHAAALALPSALLSALLLIPLYLLLRSLAGRTVAALASVLVLFNPIVWINSVRPMSDLTGFAAIVTAQCLLVAALAASEPARATRLWMAGVVVAALSVGVRLQALLLVAPVIAVGMWRMPRVRAATVITSVATSLVWIVPTVLASGGIARLWASQMRLFADAWPVEPLASSWSLTRAGTALADTFVAPWGPVWFGLTMIALAGAGLWRLRRDRPAETTLLLWLFAPYLVYHLFLQWTETLRYTIPAMPLVAVCAAAAIHAVTRRHAVRLSVAAAAVLAAAGSVTVPALREYAREPSPPARATDYLRRLAATSGPLVVAGNHVFRRHLEQLPEGFRMIDTDVREEWRALNRYWVGGGQESIWFLRDPSRTILRLIDPAARRHVARWQWSDSLRRLLRGERPVRVELVRIEPPRWFAENGFRLSGDAGPPERVARGPHLLFVRGDLDTRQVLISGRAAGPGTVSTMVGNHPQDTRPVSGAFSVAVVPRVPDASPYVPVQLTADVPLHLTDVTIAPVEAEPLQLVHGFFPAERDRRGRSFRWMGPASQITIARSGAPVRLTLVGRVPLHALGSSATLVLAVDGAPANTHALDAPEFELHIDLPDAEAGATTTADLSVSRSFVPDHVERNGDRRVLTLRLYGAEARRSDGGPAGNRRPD